MWKTWTFYSWYTNDPQNLERLPCPSPSRTEDWSRCWRAPTVWHQSSTYHTPESGCQGTPAPQAPPRESGPRSLKNSHTWLPSVLHLQHSSQSQQFHDTLGFQGNLLGLTVFPQHHHADSRVAQLDERRDALRWVTFSGQQQVFGTDVPMNDVILLLRKHWNYLTFGICKQMLHFTSRICVSAAEGPGLL